MNVLAVSSHADRLVRAIHDVVTQPDLRLLPFNESGNEMHLLTVSNENYALMQQIIDVVEGHTARTATSEVEALRARVAALEEDLRAEEAASAALAQELVEARRAR